MPLNKVTAICSSCGLERDPYEKIRTPCPNCGGLNINFELQLGEEIRVLDELSGYHEFSEKNKFKPVTAIGAAITDIIDSTGTFDGTIDLPLLKGSNISFKFYTNYAKDVIRKRKPICFGTNKKTVLKPPRKKI